MQSPPVRRPPIRGLTVVALAALACGGGPATGPDARMDRRAAAPIQTDRPVYALGPGPSGGVEVTIGLRYENATGGPAYIPTCHGVHPPELQKRVGSSWVTVYSPVVLLCLGPPVVVQPGGVYTYAYRVVAYPRGGDMYPQFELDETPGTYRLAWGIYETWTPDGPEPGLGRLLPLAARVSNEFQLTE